MPDAIIGRNILCDLDFFEKEDHAALSQSFHAINVSGHDRLFYLTTESAKAGKIVENKIKERSEPISELNRCFAENILKKTFQTMLLQVPTR